MWGVWVQVSRGSQAAHGRSELQQRPGLVVAAPRQRALPVPRDAPAEPNLGAPGCDCPRVWGRDWERRRWSPCPEPGCSPCLGSTGQRALPLGSPGSRPALHPAPGRAAALGSSAPDGTCQLPACSCPLEKALPGSHRGPTGVPPGSRQGPTTPQAARRMAAALPVPCLPGSHASSSTTCDCSDFYDTWCHCADIWRTLGH